MRIVINTFGTRGDVQPYIALGVGLKEAGHIVRLVSHQIFEDFIRGYDLDFHPLQVNPRQVLVSQVIAELGNNMFKIMRWMEGNFKLAIDDVFEETLSGNQGADLMINTGLSFAGWHVAEKLNLPAIAAYLWPAIPSRYIPPTSGMIPPDWLPFRGLVNFWSLKFSNQLFFSLLRKPVNECREKILNLPPLRPRDYWPLDSVEGSPLMIFGYSPNVLPKPLDWGENQQIAGYWFLDSAAGYQPEPDLEEFLTSGPPPVYVGFGSMVDHEREQATRMVVEALAETGQRGILLGGWSELGAEGLPESILLVDSVPHDWLFPRMAAVVHHGGAGTTAAGLRAGVPSVVVPAFADQFFWGWRVEELGAGPNAIPRQKLTSAKLAEAIRQAVEDEGMRSRAKKLGEQIRAEDGVGNAVEVIEEFALRFV
jgi:UDP:flavonoid glycosyltransferase YjiC (YdhE family)